MAKGDWSLVGTHRGINAKKRAADKTNVYVQKVAHDFHMILQPLGKANSFAGECIHTGEIMGCGIDFIRGVLRQGATRYKKDKERK